MEALPKLSPAQALFLRTATRRADGRVIPPETLRGGARVKVLAALLQRGWIEPADDGHVMTDAGYAAIGLQRPAPLDDVQSMDTTDDWSRSRSWRRCQPRTSFNRCGAECRTSGQISPNRRSCYRCATLPACGGSCFQPSSADWRTC